MSCNFSAAAPMVTVAPISSPLPGYRFHPTDEELVNYYLKRKILGQAIQGITIPDVNVCAFDAWDLPDQSSTNSGDQEWYFFCPRNYKYNNSKRVDRTTTSGFWKPTGDPRTVKTKRGKREIGKKKTLVFYQGHLKGKSKTVRTKWVIHEYEWTRDPNSPTQEDFVLCKLKIKAADKAKKGGANHPVVASDSTSDEGQTSYHVAADLENQNPNSITAMPNYEGGGPSYHTPYDSENQIPDDWNFISISDLQLSSQMTTNSGNHNGLIPFDFQNQFSTYEEGKVDCLIPCVFESPSADGTITISPYDIGELGSLMMAPNSENHTVKTPCDYENKSSTYEEGNSGCWITSYFNSQFLSGMDAMSGYDIGEFSGQMASNSENHNVMMPCDFGNLSSTCNKGNLSCLMFTDSANGNADQNTIISNSNEGEWRSSMTAPSDFTYENQQLKTNMPTAEQEADSALPNVRIEIISSSDEGEWSPQMTTPSDIKIQNQHEKTYMSTVEQETESFVADSILPEMNPELLEEMKAFFMLEYELSNTS